MAIRFDHNNNNSEWMEEMQMLFNKINNRSPCTTFNLKNYLLVLATTHCNPTAICYCENKQDTQNTDTKEIKFLRTRTHFFGKEFGSTKVKIGISNLKTFWDCLLELRNEFYSFVLDENPIEDYKDFLIKNKKIIISRTISGFVRHFCLTILKPYQVKQ
ncbi:hypothetical protein [Helicobacter pylori]|uniref:hypothetical protein n=1 Tax=Helicobacter pylori TaxID=210 RepID=UPI001EEA7C7B|nr:hypothetical protein [Helicobacter pylori]